MAAGDVVVFVIIAGKDKLPLYTKPVAILAKNTGNNLRHPSIFTYFSYSTFTFIIIYRSKSLDMKHILCTFALEFLCTYTDIILYETTDSLVSHAVRLPVLCRP